MTTTARYVPVHTNNHQISLVDIAKLNELWGGIMVASINEYMRAYTKILYGEDDQHLRNEMLKNFQHFVTEVSEAVNVTGKNIIDMCVCDARVVREWVNDITTKMTTSVASETKVLASPTHAIIYRYMDAPFSNIAGFWSGHKSISYRTDLPGEITMAVGRMFEMCYEHTQRTGEGMDSVLSITMLLSKIDSLHETLKKKNDQLLSHIHRRQSLLWIPGDMVEVEQARNRFTRAIKSVGIEIHTNVVPPQVRHRHGGVTHNKPRKFVDTALMMVQINMVIFKMELSTLNILRNFKSPCLCRQLKSWWTCAASTHVESLITRPRERGEIIRELFDILTERNIRPMNVVYGDETRSASVRKLVMDMVDSCPEQYGRLCTSGEIDSVVNFIQATIIECHTWGEIKNAIYPIEKDKQATYEAIGAWCHAYVVYIEAMDRVIVSTFIAPRSMKLMKYLLWETQVNITRAPYRYTIPSSYMDSMISSGECSCWNSV